MGYRPAHMIEKAAMHLIGILKEEGQIDYDHFYDGGEETSQRLIEGIGITREEADTYCAEALMDNAAYELEEQDIVRIEQLQSVLADGEPNYRVILTQDGKEKLRKGVKLEFYPAE